MTNKYLSPEQLQQLQLEDVFSNSSSKSAQSSADLLQSIIDKGRATPSIVNDPTAAINDRRNTLSSLFQSAPKNAVDSAGVFEKVLGKAQMSDIDMSGEFNQALPDVTPLNLEKYPSKVNLQSLTEKFPSSGNMSFNDQLDIPRMTKEIPLQKPSDRLGNMFSQYGKTPVDSSSLLKAPTSPMQAPLPSEVNFSRPSKSGFVPSNLANSINPEDALDMPFSQVGSVADKSDDLARAMARKELWESIKSGGMSAVKSGAKSLGKTLASPTALAGAAASLGSELVANASQGSGGAFSVLDAGAVEGSGDYYHETGGDLPNKAKPDAPAFDEKKADPFTKPTDMQDFFGENNPEEKRALASEEKKPEEIKAVESKQIKAISPDIQKAAKNPEAAIAKADKELAKAEAVISNPDTSDKEMDDAIKQRNLHQFLGGLMKASQEFGAAIGGGSAQVLKADTSFAESLIANAGQGVKDVSMKRESKKQKMELQREQEKNDPKSSISGLYREGIFKVAPHLANDPRFSSMSAYDAEKAFPTITSAFNAVETREAGLRQSKDAAAYRQLQREQLLSDKQEKHDQIMLKGYQSAAQSHPRMKDAMGALDEAGTVQDVALKALKEGGQSVSALGTKMAKFMGEKGALTAADVTRYIESPSLRDSILSSGSRAFTGKISNKDYKQISSLVNVIQERLKQRVNSVYENSAQLYSRNAGHPIEKARFLINPTIDEAGQSNAIPEQKQAAPSNDMVKVKLPDGRQGQIPRSNLAKAMERGAVEVK